VGQINREIIEEVRAAANIVDVVGSHVSLRKRGKNYLGLCPFHGEKEPSFTVSDEKQIFHCFGCGASGSVFDFLMRSRNLSFAEAVKELANRFSIPLPQRQETGREKRMRELAERLRHVNELAAAYFNQVLLDENTGAMALTYLQSRGMAGDYPGFPARLCATELGWVEALSARPESGPENSGSGWVTGEEVREGLLRPISTSTDVSHQGHAWTYRCFWRSSFG